MYENDPVLKVLWEHYSRRKSL